MGLSILETFQLTGVQRQAATLGCDLSVSAGAGTGKTRALTARYLRLVEDLMEAKRLPRGVTAITFTERATREMRNRIRVHIQKWLNEGCPEERRAVWVTLQAEMDAARIGTIHSLCAAILRAHPAEAEIDPRFDVLEEGMAAALQAQAVEDALSWATGQDSFRALFELFTTDDLTETLLKLVHSRLEAETAFERANPAQALQGALRDAVGRFLNDPATAGAIAALRGLRDASRLLRDAGDKLAAQVISLLAQWEEVERAQAAGDDFAAATALLRVRQEWMDGRTGKRESEARAALAALRDAYDAKVDPWLGGKDKKDLVPDPAFEARVAAQVTSLRDLFEHAQEVYRRAKDQRQALDFDDLEEGALKLLQRPEVRARWERQLDALLVDEFQDTNERQRQIIDALAGSPEGRAGRLFVVGDPKQSIYRFRGADVTVFRRVEQEIRARGGQYLSLDETFRAHPPLVAALNEILANVMGIEEDPARPYRVPFRALEANKENASKGRPPYIEFLCGRGDTAGEARPAAAALLARRLLELQKQEKWQWNEVACLFRASTGFPAYEAAFERAGIPFVTVAGRGFYDRPEIRDLLNILRALADPTDDLALAGLLRSPAIGLSDAALYQLRWPGAGRDPVAFRTALQGDLAALSPEDAERARDARELVEELTGLVHRVPVAELLGRVLDQTGYPAMLASAPAGERLQRNVDKLLADAQDSGLVSVAEFLEYLDTLQEAGAREGEAPAEAGGSVRLMSVHKAKGLEFPLVVIADAARSRPAPRDRVLLLAELGVTPNPGRVERTPLLFQLARAEDQARADAEDLRLLYVAATRAQQKLLVCAHETGRGQVWFNRLLAAAGVDIGTATGAPDRWQFGELACGQRVGLLASADLECAPNVAPERQAGDAPGAEARPLYEPVSPRRMEAEESPQAEADPAEQARRATRRQRQRDGTLAGELFHRAVARWCFPPDARLDRLLRAGAADAGWLDKTALEETLAHVRELLLRLRSDPAWAEIDAARRYHEVPYRLMARDQAVTGYIDLLYRRPAGTWRIVDFKTEAVTDPAGVAATIRDQYIPQLDRYARAVDQLLGQRAEGVLCFPDWQGAVHWERR